MRELLILCDQFPPAFGPRMGYLCKYLKGSGWRPVVVTEHLPDHMFTFLTGFAEVTEVRYYKTKRKWLKRLEWLLVFILEILCDYKNRKMAKAALRLVPSHSFELILCSTYRTFPLPAAQKVASKTGLPLIIDLRDIIEQYTGNEFIAHPLPKLFGLERLIARLFRAKNLHSRNKALRAADRITTVSPWHVEMLKPYNPNVSLIYNGYDPELFFPESIKTEQFLLTYTGRILSTAMRNPELLFEAVAQLSKEETISPLTFRIRWYVDVASRQIIEQESKQYDIREYMDFFGYVPASEIPEILNQSSMLLILTNKAVGDGPKGIMTTKFFESLAVAKPILCVRGDEGCLEEAIQEARAGLSAHRTEEVVPFIRHFYEQWRKTGETRMPVDHEVVQSYSRKNQAEQFIRIFNELTHS